MHGFCGLFGEIGAVVAAAAFAAVEGGLGDEEADAAHAAEFVVLARGIFALFHGDAAEDVGGVLEAGFVAGDAAVFPGDGAQMGFG